MKINNIILIIFILVFFSACYKKIDNTSLNEDYKILNQVSVIGTLEDLGIMANKMYGIFPCPVSKEENYWTNVLIDKHQFSEILEAKGIEVLDLGKPVKRLIFIKPLVYSTYDCSPEGVTIDVFLYDIEGISPSWALKSYEDIIKEIRLLGDTNLIYTNRYRLDSGLNPRQFVDFNFIAYWWNGTNNRDIRKFFNKVVEDLEKVVRFPYSLNN